MSIAENIKKLREDKGLMQKEVAAEIGLKCPKRLLYKTKHQPRLLAQLNEKDKSIVMNIIDTMLTKQKFQTFFEQNIQIAK